MRWWPAVRGVLVVMLMLAAGVTVTRSLAAGPPDADELTPPGSALPSGEVQRRLWVLTNQARAAESARRTARGDAPIPPLRYDRCLERAAQAHTQAMADGGFFDHDDPRTGTDPRRRAEHTGLRSDVFAENIAGGSGTLEAIFGLWANSRDGHRENLLAPDLTAIGIGYADRTTRGRSVDPLYTQLFGGSQPADAPLCT